MKTQRWLAVLLCLLLSAAILGESVFADTYSTALTVTVPCQVELQVGTGGKVTVDGTEYTGSSALEKQLGTAVEYCIFPDDSYRVDKVVYNGTNVTAQLADNVYTAPPLENNAVLSVTFRSNSPLQTIVRAVRSILKWIFPFLPIGESAQA